MRSTTLFGIAAAVSSALACDSCYGPASEVIHERNVRRMQPEAQDATVGPKAPLEWGQLNFLHTVSYPPPSRCNITWDVELTEI
jgi:hypothetical protein